MERCLVMKEERVTINILNWLESNGWKIICYDFPQSGTGVLLHPNSDENRTTKNKGGIIPDILATRNSVALFFENKDRFVLSDFEKLKEIKSCAIKARQMTSVTWSKRSLIFINIDFVDESDMLCLIKKGRFQALKLKPARYKL